MSARSSQFDVLPADDHGMETKPTIVVADDHPPVLESVSRYLDGHGLRVVGRAKNGEEAIALIETQRPALALVDLRMPRVPGGAVVRQVSRTTSQTATVVYTGFSDGALLTEALDAGARGFVLKDAPFDALLRALDTVISGGMYIDPALADAVISAANGEVKLTPRERDVLRLLADGHSNESMGRELFISPDTARTQLGVAMAKLGAATRTQAVAIALRQSLIS